MKLKKEAQGKKKKLSISWYILTPFELVNPRQRNPHVATATYVNHRKSGSNFYKMLYIFEKNFLVSSSKGVFTMLVMIS